MAPSTGLQPSVANPVATLSATATHVVTGTTANGCSAKDTVVINVLPKPVITLQMIHRFAGTVQLNYWQQMVQNISGIL